MSSDRVMLLVWFATLAMLDVAVFLIFRVAIDPYNSWQHFISMVVTAHACMLVSLAAGLPIIFGRPPVRAFSIGFFLGAVLENRALVYFAAHDLLQLMPGTWLPEGWYPLTIPVERVFIVRGWGSPLTPNLSVSAHFVGMALSGILCGVLLMAAHACWRRVVRSE